ncbi:EpsG family protein [Enterococcus hailinensis]|uniref:EpsG family protein n=1 Tax=Enterococcus hailinensis TaxID=3238988 RepID=UPI0038B2A0A3
MELYLIQYVLIVIIVLSFKFIRLKGVEVFLLCGILVVPMGLRSFSVGTDTRLYGRIFMSYGETPYNQYEGSTYLYFYWNKLIYYISSNYGVYLLITAALMIGCLIIAIYMFDKKSFGESIILFYSLYFYLNAFNLNRQYLALSISFLAIILSIKTNKVFIPLLICLVAVLVHNTSIFYLIYFIFRKINWSSKSYLILSLLVFVIGKLKNEVFKVFSTIFTHYSLYNSENFESISQGNKKFLGLFYMVVIILAIFYLNSTKVVNKDTQKYGVIIALSIVGCIISIFFGSDILLGRIENYFSIFQILIIPFSIRGFLKLFGSHELGIYGLTYIILFCVLLVPLLFQLNSNISQVLPYSVWLK